MVKLKNILCAVDFSDYSLEALEYAEHLALMENACLYLVHIIDSRLYDYGGPIYEPDMHTMDKMVDQASMDRLNYKLQKSVSNEIKNNVKIMITFGVPFVEIIKAAKDLEVDLIVMGTHGRSGIMHILIGSVAERVVRKAPCPVLTVKSSVL